MDKPHDDASYPVRKTDAQWRAELDAEQYQVARHAATERPFSGRYWDHWEAGEYRCIGCGTPLFASHAKFDAGCGWPSWYEALDAQRVERLSDSSLGMTRVEIRCRRCGSHLGHVFDDGPQPTGERFCVNSAAIAFQGFPRVRMAEMEAALRTRLQPLELQIIDDSAQHIGHAGSREGGHYTVQITASAFAGLPRVARHRLVYDALSALLPQGIHALAVKARAPGEATPATPS